MSGDFRAEYLLEALAQMFIWKGCLLIVRVENTQNTNISYDIASHTHVDKHIRYIRSVQHMRAAFNVNIIRMPESSEQSGDIPEKLTHETISNAGFGCARVC